MEQNSARNRILLFNIMEYFFQIMPLTGKYLPIALEIAFLLENIILRKCFIMEDIYNK